MSGLFTKQKKKQNTKSKKQTNNEKKTIEQLFFFFICCIFQKPKDLPTFPEYPAILILYLLRSSLTLTWVYLT